MVFKSDRQRKAFFAKQGNPRSDINPQLTKREKILSKVLRKKDKTIFIIRGDGINETRSTKQGALNVKKQSKRFGIETKIIKLGAN